MQVCKLASDLMGTTVSKIENDEFSDDCFAAGLVEDFLFFFQYLYRFLIQTNEHRPKV